MSTGCFSWCPLLTRWGFKKPITENLKSDEVSVDSCRSNSLIHKCIQKLPFLSFHQPRKPQTSHDNSLVASSASMCPPSPPSDHHNLCPPLPPLTTTNESSQLVGGFLGFHVTTTAYAHRCRL